MKRIALLTILSFLLQQLHAQYSLDWAKSFGSQQLEYCYDMAVDQNGNVVYCGIFTDSADMDPGPGVNMLYANGDYDFFVLKTDPAGNFLWAKSVGGEDEDVASAITTDAAGNVYIGGYYQLDTVDFDPGPGTYNFISVITRNAFLLKLDAAGNFAWAGSMAGTGGWDWAIVHEVEADNSGNVYATGEFIGLVDFDPGAAVDTHRTAQAYTKNIFLTRFTTGGTYVWTRTCGGTSESIGTDLATDNAGNIYMTGYFASTVDFNPGPATYNLTSNGVRDAFVARFDNSGNLTWAQNFGSDSSDYAYGIAVHTSGDVVVCGAFTKTADFDPDPSDSAMATANASQDGFVVQFSSSGNFQWFAQVGGRSVDSMDDLKTDSNGNVYIAGNFNGWFSSPDTIDFDPGPDTAWAYVNFSTDAAVLKLNSGGGYEWHALFTGSGIDIAAAVAIGPGDDVFAAGPRASSNNDYDPTPFTYPLPSAGSWDVFGVRLNQTCNTYGVSAVNGCGSYTVPSGNQTYTANGNVLDTIPNAAGCDSILLINITLLNTQSAISAVVCDMYTAPDGNETYSQSGTYVDTLTNAAGCDSIITISLTVHHSDTGAIYPSTCNAFTVPSGNATFNASGIYHDTVTTIHGCDSIITIYLTILPATFDTVTATSCLSYLSPDSSVTWTASGIYSDTLMNVNGCDSIITVDLTIIPVNVTVSQFNNILIAGAANAQYQWLDCGLNYAPIPNDTQSLFVPQVDGSYAVLITENGCSDTSDCETIIGIGLNENSAAGEAMVYPNPGNGTFTVSGNVPGAYTLTNALGQSLMQFTLNAQNGNTTVIADLAPGIYFLQTPTGSIRLICD